MNAKSRMPAWAIGVGAAALAFESFAGTVSESFTAFLRPDESSFWRTAPGKTVTVPVEFPEGATKATLTVKGDGHSAEYADIATDSFTFDLPEAKDAASENVYELTLSFDDAAKTIRTAKIGLIAGLCPDNEGRTRCLAPAGTRKWNRVRNGRAVLPIPYGMNALTIDGVATDTGLGGGQGWYRLDGLVPKSPTELELSGEGGTCRASLFAAGGHAIFVR